MATISAILLDLDGTVYRGTDAISGVDDFLSLLKELDIPFLFVYGAETDEVTFPDLHVVDLSEETDEGYAPTIEATALKKSPRELPVGLAETYFLSARFMDRTGRQPAAGWPIQYFLPV